MKSFRTDISEVLQHYSQNLSDGIMPSRTSWITSENVSWIVTTGEKDWAWAVILLGRYCATRCLRVPYWDAPWSPVKMAPNALPVGRTFLVLCAPLQNNKFVRNEKRGCLASWKVANHEAFIISNWTIEGFWLYKFFVCREDNAKLLRNTDPWRILVQRLLSTT